MRTRGGAVDEGAAAPTGHDRAPAVQDHSPRHVNER